jgi:hypothetical protein
MILLFFEQEFTKFKFIFINYKRNMDELCKKLTGTYNTNFLDNYDPEIGKEFLKASEKYKNSGKGKNILMNLIHNHFEPKKEYPKFIGGPKSLTLQWSDEYQMMIYIFGEYHSDEMNCNKIKGYNSSLYTMPIEEFLAKVITETDAFIDLYIEVPAYLKEVNEYKDNFKPFPDAYRLSELLKKFRKCIQYTTRAAKECKLARVHYFDIRYKDTDGSIQPVNDIGFVKIYTQLVLKSEKQSDKVDAFKIFAERTPQFINILNGSVEKDIRKSMDFWKSYIYTNSFITKEMDKIKDHKLRQKILDFIENELLNEILLCQLVLNTSSKDILDYMAGGDKVSDITFINSFKSILNCLIGFNAIIVDAYTIARIFKDFDMTDMQKKAYKGSIDQPINAHNIIIYAGDDHCLRYRKFLQSIGFKQYGKSGDFGISVTTCLNISNFKTPFFSELPPILR